MTSRGRHRSAGLATATLAPTQPPRSVRGELVAQDCSNILALAQQSDHIKVVGALEVAPEQWKLCRPPRLKPWNPQASFQGRRADAGVELDLVKRGGCGTDHRHRNAGASLLAGVADLGLLVAQRLRLQYRRLQPVSPRMIVSSSF